MFSDIKSGDFHPLKSFGQTFLTKAAIADALVAAVNLQKGELVLEIGPGTGILTERLLRKGAQVIAVEIDQRLVQFLKKVFANYTNLKVVSKDFLQFDLSQFSSLKVIGNIPFNISSQVFFKLWEGRQAWVAGVFTTQREFARRILSPPGTKDYGVLTVLYDYLCEKRKLFNIPARFFYPQPKVSATAFLLKRHTKPVWRLSDEKWFYKVVHSAFFPQRRKRLLNNLCENLKMDRKIVLQVLNRLNLAQNSRAEDITLEQFALLSEMLLPHQHNPIVPDSS